jgi:hypothetical protein
VFGAQLAAALLIGLVGLSLPRTSGAQQPFELSWSAPAECPSGAEVRAVLERLAAAGSRVEGARVEIVPVEGRWQARLSTRGAQRRLEGESCAAVVHALTVVLALAAAEAEGESDAGLGAAAPVPQAAGAVDAREMAPDVALAAPRAAKVTGPGEAELATPGLGWAVRAGLLAELGLLPGPTLGPQAAVELSFARWSVELGATLLLARHARLAGEGTPEGDIDWLGGQVSLCHQLGPLLALCAGAESGRLSGTGSGVDEPLSAAGWWLAATAEARLRGLLSSGASLSWQLGLSAAAALARPEFGFDELGVLHRPSAVSGRLFFGLGWGH